MGYLHRTSFSLIDAMGTPAVLGAIAVVIAAQLLFTYVPFMQELFGTAPVAIIDGLLIVLIGVVTMVILEVEKGLSRRAML